MILILSVGDQKAKLFYRPYGHLLIKRTPPTSWVRDLEGGTFLK